MKMNQVFSNSQSPASNFPIRVGYLIWSLGLGGAEQVVIRLAAGLNRRQFDPVIFCLNQPGAFAAQAERVAIPVIALNKRGPVDLLMVWRLAKLLRKHRIDVLHTHLWGANGWGRIAARLAGVRSVIITEHNVDSWKRNHHFVIDRALVSSTTRFIAVSQQVKAFYESHGIAPSRWRVIYNGVAVTEKPPRQRLPTYEKLGIHPNEQAIGLIGRLVPAKSPKLFVDAMAQVVRFHPTAKALIIGDGPLKDEVQSYVKKLGLQDRIILTGTRQDVPDLLAGMDVLAFSSEREGLSMAMLEAMAAGVPVVATRVGGTPELIESSVSGLLVPPRDANALAEAVLSLLQNREKAEQIQRQALKRVQDHFSVDQMVAAHERLYRGFPIRVALVVDHLNRGGAQRQLVELAKGLEPHRWEAVVIALSTEKTALHQELLEAGVPVYLIHQYGAVDLSCLYRLTALLKRLHPAIVHTWLFTADTYGRLAARMAGVPHCISAIRNTIDDMPWHYRAVNAWLSHLTDAVTINVDAIRPRLIKEAGVPNQKIRTIYNGIQIAEPPANNGLLRDLPAARPRIAMVARLSPQKDHKTFLEAAARVAAQHPSAQFLIVGEGALRMQIEEQINRLNLRGCAHLLGERRDVRLLLSEMDLCVLASHYEGCSNVIMEAMAAGKPVVATRVGGNPELVVDGVTGFLVSPQDPQQLAGAMSQVLSDSSLAQQMGQAGRRRIEESFSLSRMVEQTAVLYKEVLTGKPERHP